MEPFAIGDLLKWKEHELIKVWNTAYLSVSQWKPRWDECIVLIAHQTIPSLPWLPSITIQYHSYIHSYIYNDVYIIMYIKLYTQLYVYIYIYHSYIYPVRQCWSLPPTQTMLMFWLVKQQHYQCWCLTPVKKSMDIEVPNHHHIYIYIYTFIILISQC